MEDHQVAVDEEDQDAEHQGAEEEGASKTCNGKRKYTLTGTDIIAVDIMQTATRVRTVGIRGEMRVISWLILLIGLGTHYTPDLHL